jgi:nucleoside-diphosphate-sugar epimerase
MKILVAGGGGYIGGMLVPSLIEHGYEVHVVDLLWFGNNLPKEAFLLKEDIFNLSVDNLKGYDQVIFLAGLSNDPMAEFSPAMNFVYNAALPGYLAFQAKQAGVKRFIYASSCSVYGYTVDQLYDEESPATCDYPYGISKLQGERGCIQLADENFSVIALRQGTVAGYSPRMRFDLVVNAMVKSALKDEKITVNNPSIWRPILDIRDAVTAYLRAIQANQKISGVFNVSSGNYTVGQLGDIIKEEVEEITGKKIGLEIKNVQDFRNYKVSIAKAKTYLGFEPKHTIKGAVDTIFNKLEKIGDFKKKDYYNIEVFKEICKQDEGPDKSFLMK